MSITILYKAVIFIIFISLPLFFGYRHPQWSGMLSVGLGASLFLLAFLLYDMRNKISNTSLFSLRSFIFNILLRGQAQIVLMGIVFFIPLYLQTILHYSPWHIGWIMLFLTVTFGVMYFIADKWIAEEGPKWSTLTAMTFYIVACVLFYQLPVYPHFWAFSVALLFVGIASSLIYVSTQNSILSISKNYTAYIILFMLTFLSASAGLWIAVTIMAVFSKQYLFGELMAREITFPMHNTATLEQVANGVLSPLGLAIYKPYELLPKLTELTASAFIHGFETLMILLLIFLGIGVLCVTVSDLK